jgi:hypothetical protein
MGGLFLVRVVNVQVQVVEEGKAQASLLVALGAVVLQGWIGQVNDAPSPAAAAACSSDEAAAWSENEVLQRMVRRELPRFVEAVSVQVSGCGAFVAPTDLDGTVRRGGHHWLRRADPTPPADLPHRALHQGVFQCVLAPFAAEVAVVVEHGPVPVSSLRLRLHPLRVEVDSENTQRLLGIAAALAAEPATSPARGDADAVAPQDGEPSAGVGATVREAWRWKRAAQWEVVRLRTLKGQLELAAAGVLPAQDLDALGETPTLGPWAAVTDLLLVAATRGKATAAGALGTLVGRRQRSLQVKPHMHITWCVGGLRLDLLAKNSNVVALRLGAITGQFANVRLWSRTVRIVFAVYMGREI